MQPDQDKGLAHCHYIRQLAMELWTRENSGPAGKTISWEESIKRALNLHIKKLQHMDKITIKKPSPPVPPKLNPPRGNIPPGYCGWG